MKITIITDSCPTFIWETKVEGDFVEIWEKPKSMLSYSYIFFSEPTNREMDEAALNLADPERTGQNYCPAVMLSDGNGGYIGAFRDASDNWLDGWMNYDPQKTVYWA